MEIGPMQNSRNLSKTLIVKSTIEAGMPSMLLPRILTKAKKDHSEEEAVVCGDIRYTYLDFCRRAMRFASALSNLGLRYPDRVAIIHKNCHYFLESYFAVAQIGAVLVPINHRLLPKDFSFILKDSDSKGLITEARLLENVTPSIKECPELSSIIITGQSEGAGDVANANLYEDIIKDERPIKSLPSEIQDTEMAHLYYTSGTTGKPKGVVLTHRNNYIHAINTVEEIQLTNQDRWLHVSPMYHLADAWSAWAVTQVGGAHTFVPEFNPTNVLETIERDKVTVSNFIPTMLNMLVNRPDVKSYDCSSLRLIMSGGAPIAPEIVRKIIEEFGCEYIQTYGMTETSPFLTMSILKSHLRDLPFDDRLRYLATTGRPFKGVNLKVVKEDGTEVEKDDQEVGEIIVKGDTITPGYWKLPHETEKRMKDGWLHTRDLATVNEEGYLTIVDRMDDMIITGGENVYSIEVENVLYEHPKVLEAAVIGIRDEVWGEKIVAIVVPKKREHLAEDEIVDHCKGRLAPFKAPKEIIQVNELPKTESGKIKKNMLREKYRG